MPSGAALYLGAQGKQGYQLCGDVYEDDLVEELVGRTDSDSARALLKELDGVCDTVRVLGVYSRSAKEERE